MEELWQTNGNFVTKEDWGQRINQLNGEPTTLDKTEAKHLLREKLISAVKSRLPEDKNQKVGIFFSGGVDSAFIAAIAKIFCPNLVCYVVGFQDHETKDPADVIEAKKVAEKLGLKLIVKRYDLAEAKEVIEKTVKILKPVNKTDVVNVGVGAVVLAATELGKTQGINYFLGGLGSEEIFAGYERHDKVKCEGQCVNNECWNGLKQMWSRDLVRDFNLAKALEATIKTPFLDQELIRFAMTLPEEWKIVDEKKKVILREVAEEFLGEFAWRKKKAAQYGSCFDKAISKIAKRKGFKLKKEWLDSI